MDGYTLIRDKASLEAANTNNMQIFKKKEDGSPEEVTENKEIFVEGGLFTKNDVASPVAEKEEEQQSSVSQQLAKID